MKYKMLGGDGIVPGNIRISMNDRHELEIWSSNHGIKDYPMAVLPTKIVFCDDKGLYECLISIKELPDPRKA